VKLDIIDNHRSRFVPVPSDWHQRKMRFAVKSYQTNKNDDENATVLSLTKKGLKVKTDLAFGKSTENYVGHQVVEQGQFVFTPRDFDATPILCGVADTAGCISNLYIVFDVAPQIDARFLEFYFWGLKYGFDFFEKLSFGMRYSFNRTQFENIPLLHPDLSTQREIADFLDRETARIDLLIEKKQKLVVLLGEKAKSVNELFFINAGHTDAQPLHRLYRVVTGKTPSRNDEDNFSIEEGLPWATPANLGFLAPVETTKECLSSKGLEGQPVVDAGTVLLNGIGASVGKIGIAGTKLSFNQQIHALIAKKRVLADRFLFFQLLTLKEQLVLLANSTTLPILNAERLGRLELKIFDLDEQRRHCANMDALLQHEAGTAVKIITSIDRLKEYRSALITAAVTGQIDVTTYAKSGTTDRRLDAIQEEMGA